jgi:hypothetical protein
MAIIMIKETKFIGIMCVYVALHGRGILNKLFSLDNNKYLNAYGGQRCGHELIEY